ncbi:MAG: TIGR03084 family metal-binding protein [Pseudonocardia sp.]|nr:TIGR03084 family metal-binding protein [Pseudonocardia sp.]
MPADIEALARDLRAESDDLLALVEPLPEAGWDTPTPAPGWAVRDQVSHLAHFDEAAVRSVLDPDGFRADLEAMRRAPAPASGDAIAERYRALPGTELLDWFREARTELIEVFGGSDPALRVPWYGPPMSVASSLTARLMETWAHGQDAADGLGVAREPTARLRHVAHIGVGARRFAYATNRRPDDERPVRVELTAPDGDVWAWGPAHVPDRITGPALDFCLLVTQRRHLADTELVVTGPAATGWAEIAQAFAGPPGAGRTPGQFRLT